MKVLVAPDKFKGSLSAPAAAEAIARGWRKAWPESELMLAPIADGGEGFAEIFQQALGGEWVELTVEDPLGRPVRGRYVWVPEQKLAVLEMSEASGLWRLTAAERAPLLADTFGTGQLLRAAAERGAEKILVGLGGSATTDGGAGLAAALGYRFFGEQELARGPGQLRRLRRIERNGAVPLPVVVGACDVTNPLLGARGCARVFAPQKGADDMVVAALEEALAMLAEVVRRDLGSEHGETPGAGAAGGLGYGLLTFAGAELRPGFELIAETLGLREKMAGCDLVITGEGRLDAQTLEGKGPAGVAALARAAGKPVLALAGSLGAEAEACFDGTFPMVDAPVTLAEAMAGAAEALERAAARAARLIRLGARFSTLNPIPSPTHP